MRRGGCSQAETDVLAQNTAVLRYATHFILKKRAQKNASFSGSSIYVLAHLQLLTPDGKPFSRLFEEVIVDCLPKGKSFQEAGLAAKPFKPILDLAEMAGKLRRAFKNPNKGKEESDS